MSKVEAHHAHGESANACRTMEDVGCSRIQEKQQAQTGQAHAPVPSQPSINEDIDGDMSDTSSFGAEKIHLDTF